MTRAVRQGIALVALVSLVNAVWIFGSVLHWFETIPGVADTGLPNHHFVRDVGLVYGLFGAALLWVLRDPSPRYAVFVVATLFYLGHALGHVVEILVGALPHSHWLIDIPLVFAPGLFLATVAWPPVWRRLFVAP